MEMTVSRKTFCDYDADRTVAEIVDDTVTFFRNRGHKRDTPFEQAALALGISQRKAWSIFYGQAFTLLPSEYRRIRDGFVRHLDERADDLARRSDQARMRRRQLTMDG